MAGPTGSIQGKLIKLVPKELTHITITSSIGFTRVGYYGGPSSDFYTCAGENWNIPDCDYITIVYGKRMIDSAYNHFSTWETLGSYSVSDLLNNPRVISWNWNPDASSTRTCKVRMGVLFGERGGGASGSGSWTPKSLTLKFVSHDGDLGYIIPRFYKYFLDV